MRNSVSIGSILCMLIFALGTPSHAQNVSLTDFLIFPRPDTAHWFDDVERINAHYEAASP